MTFIKLLCPTPRLMQSIVLMSLTVARLAAFEEKTIIDAYTYAFPLVLMQVTKDVLTNTETVTNTKAPINQLLHVRAFPDYTMSEAASPNADTLYSQAWLDLSKEPIVLSVPEMGDRYYIFQLLDEWTNVLFSPGTRTTGGGKGHFAIIGPDWKGGLPMGVRPIFSPTNTVWALGRIQTNGVSDFTAVNKLQDRFKLTPLSMFGKEYSPPERSAVQEGIDSRTAPIEQVWHMAPVSFFKRFAAALQQMEVPVRDEEYIAAFASFGLVPGRPFNEKDLPESANQALEQAVLKAQNKIKANWDSRAFMVIENGWGVLTSETGNYGTNYDLRAAVAFGVLGANLPRDAVYQTANIDSSGAKLHGSNRYVIHFNKEQIPPVDAFWSISMYNDQHFFVDNPINRYALGDRDVLKFNPDGSLDLYIQNEPPQKALVSNWLPAPKDNFNLILRLYQPRKEVLDGSWKPPSVKKIDF